MRFNTIIKNFNLLNLMLLATIFVFAGYILYPMFQVNTRISPLPTKKNIGEAQEHKASEDKTPSPLEFNVIADNNIFHPERIIPIEKKAETALPKAEFVLYGTLIADDLSIAYMEDIKAPRSTNGRGKRQTALKKNSTMSGYTLKEIEADKVVMVRGEEKITVKINDPAHAKKRTELASAPTEKKPDATFLTPLVKQTEPQQKSQIQSAQPQEPTVSNKDERGAGLPLLKPAAGALIDVFKSFSSGRK